MSKGVDAAQYLASVSKQLLAGGYTFAARYYSHNPKKDLTPGEALALSKAGIYIVSVWETNPTVAGYFTAGKGHQDAVDAWRKAVQCHQPAGSPIYFAVDYDAVEGDEIAIENYFRGVEGALSQMAGPRYTVGVYGNGLICQHLLNQHLVEYTWLAMATDWTGSAGFTGWSIKQLSGTTIGGVSMDTNESKGSGGGWKVA